MIKNNKKFTISQKRMMNKSKRVLEELGEIDFPSSGDDGWEKFCEKHLRSKSMLYRQLGKKGFVTSSISTKETPSPGAVLSSNRIISITRKYTETKLDSYTIDGLALGLTDSLLGILWRIGTNGLTHLNNEVIISNSLDKGFIDQRYNKGTKTTKVIRDFTLSRTRELLKKELVSYFPAWSVNYSLLPLDEEFIDTAANNIASAVATAYGEEIKRTSSRKGKMRLSVNLYDLLTISENSSFTSCHSITPKDTHRRGGVLTYALDTRTAVVYYYEKTKNNGEPYKLWRQLVYFDFYRNSAVMGRTFGENVSEKIKKRARRMAANVLIKKHGNSLNWRIIRRNSKYYKSVWGETKGLNYIDDPESYIVLKKVGRTPRISWRHAPLCIICGTEQVYERYKLLCYRCSH